MNRAKRQPILRDGVGAVVAAWIAKVLAATALAAGVVAAAVVLYGTGSGATVSDGSAPQAAAPIASSTPPAQVSAPNAAPAAAPPSASSIPSAQASAPNATPASSSVQFSSWQFAQYSYQIYPGPANGDAQKALAGFDLSVQDQGNSVVVNLKALSSQYNDAQFTVAKGNTAYFVETTLRDDPNSQENNLNDDGVVVVDPQGYLLQS
jgi:hypothetical protein